MTRILRALLLLLAAFAIVIAGVALWARSELRASLATLDGSMNLAGLSAPVSVARDGFGIPWVRGATRADVARALGFLHAQDRFFQMDVARRRAAGELSALVGSAALDLDLETRVHRFRAEARRAVTLLKPADRAILDAYVAGVNSGLSSLGARPFEYLLLRQRPEPWRTEDSLLVVLSMFVTLQEPTAAYESTLATMHDLLPAPMFEFLAPRGTEWDTPVVGEAFPMPPPPGPDVYDLRTRRRSRPTLPRTPRPREFAEGPRAPWDSGLGNSREDAIGSNSWAVTGRLTRNGHALLANDMHLGIRVPNTWYRASLEWPDASNPPEPHRLIGTTLPGVPALVTGSNTHIAWGFTNTQADFGDLVKLELQPGNPNRYRTPDGWRDFERFDERIAIAGQRDYHEEVPWTIWGPVLARDHHDQVRAYRWVAHSAERLASTVTPLESARTIEEAFDAANGLGTPGQNFVVVDRSGRIGWTVYGAIPRRVNLDGLIPASWADGTRGWSGWLDPSEYPRIIDPPGGRLWTANARVVDGAMLAVLGDGSYEVGSRARIIRDRLQARNQFEPRDFLAIQLDTGADFLARWRQLILDTLTPAALGGRADRTAFRDVVSAGWTGQATADSAAYRLTRGFRDAVSRRVFDFLLAECYEADRTFDYSIVRRREGPLWALVTQKPMHLLDPRYLDWQELLVDAVDRTIADATRGHSGPLSERRWSEVNVVRYRHPLSGAVPLMGRWLDMPARALPGDLYTPRVHSGAIAASVRMVVSPGREEEGIMEMPTGQSGHPLSPFYANSHEAWIEGKPTPFLSSTLGS